jgi:hypothetical protein
MKWYSSQSRSVCQFSGKFGTSGAISTDRDETLSTDRIHNLLWQSRIAGVWKLNHTPVLVWA